ncbi:hypothetical protein QJQ45_013377 [Haematococcus lacustris]|nr:hypothetical protein QJQ45_013378 [Haematococcus lacustris]KAJ9519607.1 hypothetical protein QJQ45_013377 [Haematococcus lacustris]
MADGNSGLQTRGRVAAFAGPSLALPRVLQHNVIGLGNATPLQPNGKRRRTTTDDTAAGTAAGAATSSPRSSWITTQWRTAAEGRGNCLHCGEDRSMNNITRLKNHLLKCPQFLDSPAAQEAAGRCTTVPLCMCCVHVQLSGPLLLGLYVKVLTEVKALVARCRYVTIIIDGWSKSLGSAHLLGVCAGLANQATVFLDVISTAGLSATSELMLGEVLGVIEKHGLPPCCLMCPCVSCVAAVIDPNFRDKHGALLPDQMRSAEDLAARLESSNGQGDDSAAAEARDEFHTWCSDGYMVKMNLSPSIFHPRLQRDPVTWWEWYGKKTPVLQQVAQRVLSIPATSAGVERLFSVFNFIWNDRRSRLLMGRMWAMAYVYFNTRALKHQEQPMTDDAADVARWEEWMASQPVEGAPLL